ncbi:peptidoglycan-binding protein [Fulvimarina sp. 2208YS6-2-32]|uniref:Peptidoglycan-binding protein n=1 Tax=Fulvimarina uroteuthidis TaxID=3098149 RepID=A0ABU5I479_9HYPH|nr:peptidoglycan-binding protein [Fulvimarina sp. 2208YS6-2-32]MDY8109568.1 peptidoglycan-binding protein [Fulvimarina sp. 2208YS6-2-32]
MAELMGYNSSSAQRGKGHAALADLTRTLEALEDRLDRVSRTRSAASRPPSQPAADLLGRGPARGAAQPRGVGRRPELADAVSQIVMRQKVLDQRPLRGEAPRERAPQPRAGSSARGSSASSSKSASRFDRGTTTARAASVTDLKAELDRLRIELTRNLSTDVSQQVGDMRDALIDLQSAVSQNARPSIIRNEIVRLHERLDEMTRSGVDAALVADMRAQLDDIDLYLDRRGAASPGHERHAGLHGSARGIDRTASERSELKAEIERMRESLSSLASEDHLRAVEQRWSDFEERFVSEVGARDRTAELTDKLMAEMANLKEQMREFASDHSVRVSEALWKGVEARFTPREESDETFGRIADRFAHLEETLAALPEALPFEGIDRRIEALSGAIEAMSVQMMSDDRGEARFTNIDARLDDITQAISTLANNPPEFDLAPVERIEQRMQSLAERVDEIASDDSVSMLFEKLSQLNERFDTFEAYDPNEQLAGHIATLNTRLDELSESNGVSRDDMTAIETRLTSLAERIETQLAMPFEDGEAIVKLESQVGRLTEFLNSDNFTMSADMERRLGALEKRIDENAEHIFITARTAADEAVRRMLEQGDFSQGEHVTKLTEELERLQKLSTDSSVRSTDFYEAVNAALSRLVERIDAIERDYRPNVAGAKDTQAPAFDVASVAPAGPLAQTTGQEPWVEPQAPQAETTNQPASPSGLRALLSRNFARHDAKPAKAATLDSRWTEDQKAADVDESNADGGHGDDASHFEAADALESEEANRPLAIGSGAPDIAKLLERVRNQKAEAKEPADDNAKADFIAAARRAAMAAAEEAEGFNEGDQAERRGGSLSEAIARRRKPIMLAASAVLLALLALPVGKIIVEETNLFSSPPVLAGASDTAKSATAAPQSPAAPAAAGNLADKADAAKPAAAEPAIGVSEKPRRQVAAANLTMATPQAGASASTPPLNNAAFSPTSEAPTAGPVIAPVAERFDEAVAALPEGLGSQALLDAAKDADPKALFEIGLRLMEGRTVSSDPAKAAEWFERSARLDFAPAQYSLGTLYEKGNGVTRDTIAARDWYLKAAEAGNVRAMHNLAVLFATGVDGKSEPELAADWFIQAAEHGMTDSQYNLGILYARGAGVDQDLTQSYKWFAIVGQSGDKDAENKRDEIAQSLSPEQLEKAKEEVSNFKVTERSASANTVDIPEQWASAPADAPTTTASVDMTRAVRNIQAILGKLGYDAGVPDGLVGAQTIGAIKDFQQDAGLAATGEIDEALIRALLDRKNG